MERTSKTKKRRAENDDEEQECEAEVWAMLSSSFREVETVLDQNRVLIQQVNHNHHSMTPHNLAKNVALICQINGNISKVLSIYSKLSLNFSTIVHQRRAISSAARNRRNCSSDGKKVDTTESLNQSIQQ